ncbi:hypothetical protein WDH52_15555 [Streptomyces sp. TRM70308]|uniref:hypothetical protein n=1 Tax=Streptomyces sp. TRM70308 TaxID=3131932 RepID=UPI003CFFA059
MSFHAEYTLALYRAAQRGDVDSWPPAPGAHDWRALRELADAARETRRPEWGRRAPRARWWRRLRPRRRPAACR